MKIRHLADEPRAASSIGRAGLPKGTALPDFAITLLDGSTLRSSELPPTSHLLVLSDAACGPCDALLRYLPDFTPAVSELNVLVIGRGTLAANRAKAALLPARYRYGLQEHWEVSRQLQIFATPAAFLVDAHGRIAADPAVGFSAILRLAIGVTIRNLLDVAGALDALATTAMAPHGRRENPIPEDTRMASIKDRVYETVAVWAKVEMAFPLDASLKHLWDADPTANTIPFHPPAIQVLIERLETEFKKPERRDLGGFSPQAFAPAGPITTVRDLVAAVSGAPL